MTPYEREVDYAENQGIIVVIGKNSKGVAAAALKIKEDVGILINEPAFESDEERYLAFAHELAHCETGGFYTDKMSKTACDRIERRAVIKTVENLIPFRMYRNTILAGRFAEWEQAVDWDVPQRFVPVVHNVYENTRWGDVQELRKKVVNW